MFDLKDAGPGIRLDKLDDNDCIISMASNQTEQFSTVLSDNIFTYGVHTCEITVLSCRRQVGGIFVGLAPQACHLDGALVDPCCGCGWGKGTPHISWVELAGIPDGKLTRHPAVPARGAATRQYPYYLRRDQSNVERRHNLFHLDPLQVGRLLVRWGQRHHAAAFRRAGIDGIALQTLTAADLSALGVRCPVETQTLLAHIRRHFEEELSYCQGKNHHASKRFSSHLLCRLTLASLRGPATDSASTRASARKDLKRALPRYGQVPVEMHTAAST